VFRGEPAELSTKKNHSEGPVLVRVLPSWSRSECYENIIKPYCADGASPRFDAAEAKCSSTDSGGDSGGDAGCDGDGVV
jgi:hypothetical protein